MTSFIQQLELTIKKNNSLLCVGLDPDMKKIPSVLLKEKDPFFAFHKAIVDSTFDLVCCYKPQYAYYGALGLSGIRSLQKTIEYIHDTYLDIPVILDAKRGDIGPTAAMYAEEVFEALSSDAVTLNPYLGYDSIEPFLKWKNKGMIILCRTSNPGAGDFQDLIVDGKPLYIHIAQKVHDWNTKYDNCLLVVGSTWPEQMKDVRGINPNMFFLVPGIGAQGGNLEDTLKNGLRTDKSGLIISSSRAILYASSSIDFAKKSREKALETRDQINEFRKL